MYHSFIIAALYVAVKTLHNNPNRNIAISCSYLYYVTQSHTMTYTLDV